MTLRVGLIGPGAIGACHAVAVRACGASLAAVVGRDPEGTEQFAREHGVASAYSDVSQMMARETLDAVIVASPSELHVAHTLLALTHGLDVLCEVPVATSLADGQRIAAAAESSGHQVMVAHTLRFAQPHRWVYQMVQDGELRITHLLARRLLLRHDNIGWTGKRRDWADDVLWHHGAHFVDLALWLLGTAEVEVRGVVADPWPGTGKPMDVAAVLRAQSGQLASLALSYHARTAVNDVALVAVDDMLTIDDGSLRRGRDTLISAESEQVAITAQDCHFLTAVANRSMVEPSASTVLPVLHVLQLLADGL